MRDTKVRICVTGNNCKAMSIHPLPMLKNRELRYD